MQKEENEYIKRTQKDYKLAFKLQVLSEIERGELICRGQQRSMGSKLEQQLQLV